MDYPSYPTCLKDSVHRLLSRLVYPIMKTTLLVLIALTVSTSAVCANSAIPSRLTLGPVPSGFSTQSASVTSMPPLTLATASGTSNIGSKLDPSNLNFAQLGSANQTMPLPSGLILALVAIFVLALRIMGLNHARAMADHEFYSHQGKAQMFRALHEGGADH
jgi:hypothetical protein